MSQINVIFNEIKNYFISMKAYSLLMMKPAVIRLALRFVGRCLAIKL